MRLAKGTQIFVSDDETTIRAFKINGWAEEAEKPKAERKAEPKEEAEEKKAPKSKK